MPGYTDELWSQTESLRAAIDDLEFLRRLGDGTLAPDVFRHYLEQDALYLAGYAKALALLAARAPDPTRAAFWAKAAATAAVEEAALHRDLLASGEITSAATPIPSPTCLGYVSYLIATAATEPYPVAAAAVLPCFWIYADVAKRLAAQANAVLAANPDHPYARWIAAYDAPEFQAEVAGARAAVEAAAATATATERTAMAAAFGYATRYELLFWDTALHSQPWPEG
ncbi:TenA family transcriptional regulator [Skermania piniformis]|uniref:TenA family transcriptional regulator n=1 Tax=Skermania pinensis TaxID=39122 RepID=A0ABX8SDM2_9ACTN|nr:TenA family transcriptional regulator [Skermania piniformis]QXQ14705.1 TenA family transcriptional regulator [Skermania piniformis]